MKESINKVLLILLLISLVVCVFYLYITYNDSFRKGKGRRVDYIEKYDYALYSNSSSYYKKLYYELKDILKSSNVNEEEYVKKISQLFCVDFYTLNNKKNSNDIGGMDFIYSKVKDEFKDKAKDSIYLFIETKKTYQWSLVA